MVGFGVAQYSGVRWLGAVVLVTGGAWAAREMWRAVGPSRTVVVGAAYVVAFVGSHPLGRIIGTWPAVILAAAATGALAYALIGPGGSRVSTTSSPTRSTR